MQGVFADLKRQFQRSRGEFGLSEYDLDPGSAPLFLIGELLAKLHAGGIRYRNLRPGHIVLLAPGRAAIARATDTTFDEPLVPEQMAEDLLVPFQSRAWEDFGAILAGYVRGGYEFLDGKCPHFTDELLDILGAPPERPRPATPALDLEALMRRLKVKLVFSQQELVLAPTNNGPDPSAWDEQPADILSFVTALHAAGVDCASLFGARAPTSEIGAVLYNFSDPKQPKVPPAEAMVRLLPGEELTLALAFGVKPEPRKARREFHAILPLVRTVLQDLPTEPAVRFSDILIDVAQYCAAVVDKASPEPNHVSLSASQKPIIFLQYVARGSRQDEQRLTALTRNLLARSWYPENLGSDWPNSPQELSIANSLLLTYRDLAHQAQAQQALTNSGMLWSASVRGIELARVMLASACHQASSRDPEIAAPMWRLLPVALKSHANLLRDMWTAAAHEHKGLGRSGWWSFFAGTDENRAHLAAELYWAVEFLTAATTDGFSIDIARRFIHRGRAFIKLPEA